MIEIRDLRDVPLPEAMEVLLDARATRQVAEVQEAIAILHIVENYHRDLPDSPMPGRGRLVELAAEGGPKLNEFVPLELSAALGVSQQSITLLISDLLDLEYRHPLLWQQVREGRTPLWHARKIAARVSSVELGAQAALELDRRLTPQLPGLTLGRSLKLLEGLIAAIDPRGAEERAETERRKRWVRIQPTTDGVSWLDGKLNSADGRQLDGALNRFAAILGANGDSDDREARRSSAIGILSNPALALALLRQDELRRAAASAGEEQERDTEEACVAEGAPDTEDACASEHALDTAAHSEASTPAPDPHDSGGVRGAGTDESDDLPSDGPTPDDSPDLPASLLSELAAIDPQRLLPKSTLFVHVSDRAIRKGRGVARVEGIGPVPVRELTASSEGHAGGGGAGVRPGRGHSGRLLRDPGVDAAGGAPAAAHRCVPVRLTAEPGSRPRPYGSLPSWHRRTRADAPGQPRPAQPKTASCEDPRGLGGQAGDPRLLPLAQPARVRLPEDCRRLDLPVGSPWSPGCPGGA